MCRALSWFSALLSKHTGAGVGLSADGPARAVRNPSTSLPTDNTLAPGHRSWGALVI